MGAIAILLVGAGGFLALFWLTPLGVGPLRRAAGGAAPPDFRWQGYGVDEVYALLAAYGAAGAAHWRRMLLIDLIFPCFYAPCIGLVGIRGADWAAVGPIWRQAWIALLVAAVIADYCENGLLLAVIGAYPLRRPRAVAAASRCTRGKFLLLGISLALPLIAETAALALGRASG